MTTMMTGTGLPGMAVTMPDAIQFEVHHLTLAGRARLHAAPPKSMGSWVPRIWSGARQ